jgi:hypothetical protein
MKKYIYIMYLMAGLFILSACDHDETYADRRNKERAAINAYIANKKITVITEAQFKTNGEKTDTAKNEYVLFESSGVYMQIVNKGCGEKIKNGATVPVLARFDEYNILERPDTAQLTNNSLAYSSLPEKFSVTRSDANYRGRFDETSSLMYNAYQTTAVPAGWLAIFPYINVGRQTKEDEPIAKVNIIVPHSQGQTYASSSVYPCFYRLTIEKGK